MSRPIWFVNFLKRIYPSRRALAKMTRIPLVGEMIDHIIFRGDDIVYLPIDHTIQINAPLESPESVIIPSQAVEHYINQASHHWIMDFCICREADNCQDYPQELGCIFLGEPVLQINSKLGKLVSKEEALAHARQCREAGLVHMIGRNRLDSIWLGATPSEQLMTICNCCPCCCLWGIVPDLNPKISQKIVRMPGVQIQVTEDCTGCGLCADGVCFAEAISVENGRAEISLECRGCGRCVEICPEDAILLSVEGEKNIQEILNRFSSMLNPN
ncbi:MAG: 4Fe-4S binding protein [Anaerolineales bacterium]